MKAIFKLAAVGVLAFLASCSADKQMARTENQWINLSSAPTVEAPKASKPVEISQNPVVETAAVATVEESKVEAVSTPVVEKKSNFKKQVAAVKAVASTIKSTPKALAQVKQLKKFATESNSTLSATPSADVPTWLLFVLCFIFPAIAVGLATDWDITKTIIALVLSALFWIPGIIYALIVVSQNV